MTGPIRTGIGGWVFPPWRGLFYPPGLRQADELSHASRQLGAIEINSTYQSFQKPETFAKWAAQTPEGFVFAVKASRLCTNRRVLADSGEWVGRFLNQGIVELGDRLGPILWQFMPTKVFDEADFAAFLGLLPDSLGGLRLRHVVEVRNPSFADPRFTDLCAARRIAVCLADSATFPMIEAPAPGLAYVRLMRGDDAVETGYPTDQIDAWARRLRDLAGSDGQPGDGGPRDVFAFVINAGKSRAPAAALALASRITSIS